MKPPCLNTPQHPTPERPAPAGSDRNVVNTGVDVEQAGYGSAQGQGHLRAGAQALVPGNVLFDLYPDTGINAKTVQHGLHDSGDIRVVSAVDMQGGCCG